MPEISTIHQNQALTNLAIAYPMQGYIAPNLVPDVMVQKRTDLYYIFDATRRAIALQNTKRSPGAEATLVDFDVTSDNYRCEDHALSAMVPDEERENADPIFQPMIDKTEFLIEQVLLDQEIGLKTALDAALTGSMTSDPTNEWDDYTNGDPMADINLAINTIEDATGFKPNRIAMDSKVFRAVRNHPDILDRLKYTGTPGAPAVVTAAALAQVFDIEQVIVGLVTKNTSAKGAAASLSRVWGSDVYVCYQPPRPGLKIPALAYRMTWRPFSGSRFGWMVTSWREEKRKADQVQVDKYYDQKVALAACGYRLQNRLT